MEIRWWLYFGGEVSGSQNVGGAGAVPNRTQRAAAHLGFLVARSCEVLTHWDNRRKASMVRQREYQFCLCNHREQARTLYRPKNVSMVPNGHGTHGELDRTIHQVIDFTSAIEQAVIGVEVKMTKSSDDIPHPVQEKPPRL